MSKKRRIFISPYFFHRGLTKTPWYDDKQDFNTNSKSYYDYLARFNHFIKYMTKAINRALRRDIEVIDTASVDLTKTGDWIGDKCTFDDIISLKADVIISPTVNQRPSGISDVTTTVEIRNGTVVLPNGVWSPDYINVISQIESRINGLITRDINVGNTNSITITKSGDWSNDGIITITANSRISTYSYSRESGISDITTSATVTNGTLIRTDGIFSPDYENVLSQIEGSINGVKTTIAGINSRVTSLENWRTTIDAWKTTVDTTLDNHNTRITTNTTNISNLTTRVSTLESDLTTLTSRVSSAETNIIALQQNVSNLITGLNKIVANLYTSGAVTTNNYQTFAFNTGRNIATGNINFFGGTQDGTSFIRTNSGTTENDVTAGI